MPRDWHIFYVAEWQGPEAFIKLTSRHGQEQRFQRWSIIWRWQKRLKRKSIASDLLGNGLFIEANVCN
jgi:hypothetical protein